MAPRPCLVQLRGAVQKGQIEHPWWRNLSIAHIRENSPAENGDIPVSFVDDAPTYQHEFVEFPDEEDEDYFADPE